MFIIPLINVILLVISWISKSLSNTIVQQQVMFAIVFYKE